MLVAGGVGRVIRAGDAGGFDEVVKGDCSCRV